MTRKAAKRWPGRPRPTPRGIKGQRVVVYIDALVSRYVPLDRINACIQDHQRGVRVAVIRPELKEPVYKTSCFHAGFEWWAISFPRQRRLFLGPPEFFHQFFP